MMTTYIENQIKSLFCSLLETFADVPKLLALRSKLRLFAVLFPLYVFMCNVLGETELLIYRELSVIIDVFGWESWAILEARFTPFPVWNKFCIVLKSDELVVWFISRVILDIGCWTLDIGYWPLDIGYWPLDIGCWILDMGCWILDMGCWILFWILFWRGGIMMFPIPVANRFCIVLKSLMSGTGFEVWICYMELKFNPLIFDEFCGWTVTLFEFVGNMFCIVLKSPISKASTLLTITGCWLGCCVGCWIYCCWADSVLNNWIFYWLWFEFIWVVLKCWTFVSG